MKQAGFSGKVYQCYWSSVMPKIIFQYAAFEEGRISEQSRAGAGGARPGAEPGQSRAAGGEERVLGPEEGPPGPAAAAAGAAGSEVCSWGFHTGSGCVFPVFLPRAHFRLFGRVYVVVS